MSDKNSVYSYYFIDTLKVKVVSESCDDIVSKDCSHARGHITVNGHQHSLNTRGINIVLFDYRSGLYEHRNSYDVYGSSSARTSLANFLNGLTTGKVLFMSAKDSVIFDASSATALKRFGVSATFATTSLPKSRCSMAAIAYTGEERKEWEQSVNKVGGTGASVIEKTIYIFRELDGRDDCSQEMGIQSRKIPDSAFSAKSIWDNDAGHYPHRARLHQTSYAGWCAGRNAPVSDYLQIDLGTIKILTGLAIQAHPIYHGHHYVTKFTIEYSNDGSTWMLYKDIGSSNTKVFDGIRRMHPTETRVNWFHRTMIRYFRIVPSARVTESTATTCIRMELYGCTPKVPIFQHDDNKISNLNILATYSNSLTVYYTVPTQSNPKIEISTATDNKTLGHNIDQQHIRKVDSSISYDNGTVDADGGNMKIQTNQLNKMDSYATIGFNTAEPNYYIFNVDYNYQVSERTSDIAKVTAGCVS